MTTVLVAADDSLTFAGINILLDKTNFDVIATVNRGTTALDGLAEFRPDLLILDSGMPERTGLDAPRTIRTVAVIVLWSCSAAI